MPMVKRAALKVLQSEKNNARVALISQRNPLQWRHNGHDGVSYHQPQYCLLNRLVRHGSKKISKLRVTGLCARNSPVTGELPAQRASNAENVSIWWSHHDSRIFSGIGHFCIYREYDAYIYEYIWYEILYIFTIRHCMYIISLTSLVAHRYQKTLLQEICSGCIEIISAI